MITLYSNNCVNCKKVKSILNTRRIEFIEVNDMKEIINIAEREKINQLPFVLHTDDKYYAGSNALRVAKECK